MGMVLWGNLSWHPAAEAWRQVAPTAPAPESIEVLHRENGTGTYRLVGVGTGGTPIIARRSGITKAVILRTLYSKILSRLPISAPRYCAFRAEPPGFAWVFLEECGGGRP
ncbi:MAG: hypothetical protein DMD58_14955 [Gemmatimonadetes bacterium]|nr:MAG: hypothetical protein DMD58_14955 [Gemmatimonadota bacterium]